ncbi:hypothetical protein ACWEFL_07310 [Streptomyces sp. NPDC004838]
MEMQTWRDATARAADAAEAIRSVMAALGVPERDWRLIRPMVSRSGKSYVHLGVLRAEAVEQLAEALRAAVPPAPARPPQAVEMRWLDTGSNSGAMVPAPVTETDAPA